MAKGADSDAVGRSRKGGRPYKARYSVSTVLRLRDMLTDAILCQFKGSQVRGVEFDALVALVGRVLPSSVPAEVLEDSLRGLAGVPLTGELVAETSWRLAGNVPRLKQRRPVIAWRSQTFSEWVPVQITSCLPAKSIQRGAGAVLSFRVLAGTPCPLVLQVFWSHRRCRFHAQEFGFSYRKYPYAVADQLVNLRASALFTPESCRSVLCFEELSWPAALFDWNREILRKRFRVDDGYGCPRGYSSAFGCHHCAAGYTECAAATHRHGWSRGPCGACDHPDAFFDVTVSASLCVDCYRKSALSTAPVT